MPSVPPRKSSMRTAAILVPGLCDGHMHVESGMLTVTEFARAVIPHGTTSMFIDPHEIANVLGLAGVRLMHDEAVALPINVWVQMPGCVPSAPGLENAGATHRRRGCGGGHALATDHRPRRNDELPRRRGQRRPDAGRDRRHAGRRQDRRRPLRLARSGPARSTPTPPAGRPTITRARARRMPSPACARACARCCGWARPGTTSPRRSRP